MKKRLFLVLALAIAICAIFAISVSADEVTPPTRTNLQVLAEDVVVFYDGNSCPSAYIFKDQTDIPNGSYGTSGISKVLDFSYANEKFGKTYAIADIKELDIPQGITTIGTNVAHSMSNLIKITFPDSVTSFGGTGFQNDSALEECVFEHTDENSGPTSLSGWMFAGCSSLKAISFPDSVTAIEGEGNFFDGCNNLTAVYLPKKLQKIESTKQKGLFNGPSKAYLVNEPFTTSDTAPAKPTVYYFPENLQTITGKPTFEGATGLNDVLVFGEKFTDASASSYLFKHVSSTIVFLGDMTAITTSNWGNTKIIFANPNDTSKTEGFTLYDNSKTTVFCASEADLSKHLRNPKADDVIEATCYSNRSEVTKCFCGTILTSGEIENTMIDHVYIDNFDCTKGNECKNFEHCNASLPAEALSHIEKRSVTFADGFAKAGLHSIWCDNEGCEALDNDITLGAMISHKRWIFHKRKWRSCRWLGC